MEAAHGDGITGDAIDVVNWLVPGAWHGSTWHRLLRLALSGHKVGSWRPGAGEGAAQWRGRLRLVASLGERMARAARLLGGGRIWRAELREGSAGLRSSFARASGRCGSLAVRRISMGWCTKCLEGRTPSEGGSARWCPTLLFSGEHRGSAGSGLSSCMFWRSSGPPDGNRVGRAVDKDGERLGGEWGILNDAQLSGYFGLKPIMFVTPLMITLAVTVTCFSNPVGSAFSSKGRSTRPSSIVQSWHESQEVMLKAAYEICTTSAPDALAGEKNNCNDCDCRMFLIIE